MRRWCSLVLMLLLAACDKDDGDDPSADGLSGATVADGVADGDDDGPPPGDDTHGVVKLQMMRAENEGASPFPGTATVIVTLDYMDCLIAFYDSAPEWQMEGPMGAPVFTDWRDRLCGDNTGPTDAKCSVVSMTQELDLSSHLSLMYDVTMEPDLENLTLHFGPLPTAELAMCEGGGAPIVRVGSNGAVRGLDSNGDVVWEMKSFNPDKAATNQGQAIVVRAGLP